MRDTQYQAWGVTLEVDTQATKDSKHQNQTLVERLLQARLHHD